MFGKNTKMIQVKIGGFLFKIYKKNKIKSVFEFGCASGPNYLIIKDNIHQYFGYDISSEAILLKIRLDCQIKFYLQQILILFFHI